MKVWAIRKGHKYVSRLLCGKEEFGSLKTAMIYPTKAEALKDLMTPDERVVPIEIKEVEVRR